jgi:bis(5'-nucleosyl)-tetraphosphatase (symmetrical)|nr:symmetrical bis(5'-nucleosyl)-tetraphosphatase [Kofleriaceae bacterium]
MARYAIGDVQGCASSLERLLALLAPGPNDELWLVGDLVNRGPRSLDVLRWAMRDARVRVVLGNHDLHLLARAAGVSKPKARDTLDDVLGARDRDLLIDWVRAQPFVVADDAFAMVHAGFHVRWSVGDARRIGDELSAELRGAGWRQVVAGISGGGLPVPAWSEQLAGPERWRAALAYLIRVRMCFPDGRVEPDFDGAPADAPPGVTPWFALPSPAWATHTAVFGHWAALGLSLGVHHLGLDTGCVWGRLLTAIRLDDRTLTQVKAVERAG